MSIAKELIAKAERREALFGIIGLGYVGLPLAVELAKAGFTVLGYDISQRVVDGLNAGRSHIKDVSDAELNEQVKAGRFSATTDPKRLKEPDAISICVPTPLSKFKDPDVSFIVAATEAVKASLRRGQAIILESTTYPGTTREIMLPALEATGLKVGEDFFLAFSPERVDPGNATYQTRNTPKVVGGITPACLEVAVALYQPAIDTLVPVSTTEAAELVKLLENTFRSVNIGLVNEMAIVCDKLGVNVWEVIDAAATKPFGFMKFTPGPGLGGHCIPIDPHYLAWKMRALNYKTRFIDLAGELNSEMPLFWVAQAGRCAQRPGQVGEGLEGAGHRRRLQEGHRRPAREPGARHPAPARGARRRRDLSRPVREGVHRRGPYAPLGAAHRRDAPGRRCRDDRDGSQQPRLRAHPSRGQVRHRHAERARVPEGLIAWT